MTNGSIWIVIPAFNEADVIAGVLDGVIKTGAQVVVVDDASRDATVAIVDRYPVHRLRHVVNLGQGAALQTGLAYAYRQGADIVVTFDADGQMDPSDIPRICEPVLAGRADIALGTRARSLATSGAPLERRWILRLACLFTRLSTGLPITDTHNGFRALGRVALEKIRLRHNGMAHASEILHQVARRGLRWEEVPVTIRYTERSLRKGQSSLNFFNILWELAFRRR